MTDQQLLTEDFELNLALVLSDADALTKKLDGKKDGPQVAALIRNVVTQNEQGAKVLALMLLSAALCPKNQQDAVDKTGFLYRAVGTAQLKVFAKMFMAAAEAAEIAEALGMRKPS